LSGVSFSIVDESRGISHFQITFADLPDFTEEQVSRLFGMMADLTELFGLRGEATS